MTFRRPVGGDPRRNPRLRGSPQDVWEVAVGDALPADDQAGEGGVAHPAGPGSVPVRVQLDRRAVIEVRGGAGLGPAPLRAAEAPLCSGRPLFSDEDGNLLKTGDVVRFERLADTLEAIANGGADALYRGPIAEALIQDLLEEGIGSRGKGGGRGRRRLDRPSQTEAPLSRGDVDDGGPGGVQAGGDGALDRPPGGVPHVLPPAASGRSPGRLHPQRPEG